jgi:transcription antitermination factor NusG
MILDGTLERTLRRDLQVDYDHPIFIPCEVTRKKTRPVAFHLMEGYAFVATLGTSDTSIFALERTHYVEQVFSVEGKGSYRVLRSISNDQIMQMRQRLAVMVSSQIPVGTHVRVTDGTYCNLDGVITSIDGDAATLDVRFRSLERSITVPRTLLVEHTDIVQGAPVDIVGGVYRNLDGVVLELTETDAKVQIVLRSITLEAWVPRVFLTHSNA